jgi:hypothetical protein
MLTTSVIRAIDNEWNAKFSFPHVQSWISSKVVVQSEGSEGIQIQNYILETICIIKFCDRS